MAQDPPRVSAIEDFTSQVQPQPDAEENAEALRILVDEVTNYLQRLRDALVADLQDIIDDLP